MTQNEDQIVEQATRFAATVVAPNAGAWERERTFPREAFVAAADAGLCRLIIPADMGGHALSIGGMASVLTALAGADLAFAFALVVHNNLAGNIARNGTSEQRERYLPDLMAGNRIGAFLLTEPTGGSDAAAIKTTAARDGGDWVISGEKAWVSNATDADVLSVYAQTDASAGWRGIACFLVDRRTPGVELTGPYHLLGGHALGTGGFRFENVRVGPEAVLLGPGDGFKAAMSGIDVARINVAVMSCGMLSTAIDTAVGYIKDRTAFGRPLSEFQGLQWMLADAATDLEAARALADRACAIFEAGEDAVALAAHAKKFATRVAFTRMSDCMQAMGAHGFRIDAGHPIARHLSGAKMAQFLDGTSEIQNVVISRRLFQN